MYRKESEGWFKHTDFILIDMICLQIAFYLAYLIKGLGINPYNDLVYRNMAIVLELADLVTMFMLDMLHHVTQRGRYRELIATVGNVAAVGLYSRTIIVTRTPEAVIEIGDNVGISGATIYARKGIYIGENTCIGGNCKILDNDFHPIDMEERNRLLQDVHGGDSDMITSREIYIGKNCFLGCNSIILKGTVLGDGCVVGAGAVVAGKFEDNCVIAGNPAKIIKRL